MKTVYPICCGVDVHKRFLVATIITTHGLKLTYSRKRFSTFNNSLRAFKQWLIDNNCYDICMESTGKYWVPVYNILEDTIRVTVANPKWVRAIKGNKDDKKDSKWIAELFRLGLVSGSFIPDKNIRILREYMRYRSKLVACKSSEKNRFQNAFTVCNVALDAVVTDMFGKSASSITSHLLSSDVFDPDLCRSFLCGRLIKKADAVVESIEGYTMTQFQKDRILLVRSHLAFIEDTLSKIDEKINEIVEPYEAAISLLCTIPGIKRLSAIIIISEIGMDMSQFSSSKRLCCWAGLTPTNNESAGKKKSVRTSRAGVYLKPALVQVAHAAVKSTLYPYYSIKYDRIRKRRGKKRAIIATARMILTAIFHMFSTGEIWNPTDLNQIDLPQEMVSKRKNIEITKAIKLLVSNGIILDSSLISATSS